MTKTIPIEYVGMKDEETDHLYGTGIVWRGKGDIQDVPSDKAASLLWHPDVWRDARSKKEQKSEPLQTAVIQDKRFTEADQEPDPAVQVHLMPKEHLMGYALTQFGERLDPTKDESELRSEVVRLMHMRG